MTDIKKLEDNIATLTETVNALVKGLSNNFVDNEQYNTGYSFGEWINSWYDLYKVGKLKASTLRMYRNYIDNNIIPALGKLPLNRIDGLRIQQFLNMVDRDNTRKKIGNVIRGALEKAVKLRMIPYNPFVSVELPSVKTEHYKPLELSQQLAMLSAIKNERYYSVFWVLCCTGMRIGEFLALDFKKDIDYAENVLTISKSMDIDTNIVNIPKTENSKRVIPFLPLLVPHFKRLMDFQRIKPLNYNMVRLYFKRIYEKLGYDGYNLHTFRHTFISLCYYCGMREKYIQRLAGHATIDITLNIYTHILKKGNSPILEYIQQLTKTV